MKKNTVTVILASLFSAAVASFLGCGSSSSMPNNSTTMSNAILSVGDSPVNGVLSFEANIGSVVLIKTDGTQVTVLNTPTKIELSHLADIMEPLGSTAIPQGTYKQAIVTVMSAEITLLLPGSTTPVHQTLTPNPASITIVFAPPLTVGASPVAVDLDFNLAQSLTISGTTVSFNPVIVVHTADVDANENNQKEGEGQAEEMVGSVQSLGTNMFTFKTNAAPQPFTVKVDPGTEFDGIAGFAALKVGQIIELKAATNSDGTLEAKKIEAETEDNQGTDEEGLITSVTGNPATQITLALQDSDSKFASAGSTVSAGINSNTSFMVSGSDISLSGLPFTPAFSASAISDGQAVEVDSELDDGANLSASRVRLKQQALTGVVSNVTQQGSNVTFTLTLPADSAFAMLSGKTAVTVVQQPATQLSGIVSVQSGATLRVRGFVFSSGNVAASRIGQP